MMLCDTFIRAEKIPQNQSKCEITCVHADIGSVVLAAEERLWKTGFSAGRGLVRLWKPDHNIQREKKMGLVMSFPTREVSKLFSSISAGVGDNYTI